MFIFLITRDGKTHIVDFYYTYSHPRYRTICGNIIHKKNGIITLAADNTFPEICINCKNTYDDLYLSDLNYFTQMAHGAPYRLQDFLEFNKRGIIGPKEKYFLHFNRIWNKLNKLKKSPHNKKNYGYSK